MEDSRMLKTLRVMAWERVKAELNSVRATFRYRNLEEAFTKEEREKRERVEVAIYDFINTIENSGWVD